MTAGGVLREKVKVIACMQVVGHAYKALENKKDITLYFERDSLMYLNIKSTVIYHLHKDSNDMI